MRNPDEDTAEAIRLAKMAAGAGDVPVGCVISGPDGNIVGRGQNRREVNSCATGHAGIEAINEACRTLRHLAAYRVQHVCDAGTLPYVRGGSYYEPHLLGLLRRPGGADRLLRERYKPVYGKLRTEHKSLRRHM